MLSLHFFDLVHVTSLEEQQEFIAVVDEGLAKFDWEEDEKNDHRKTA